MAAAGRRRRVGELRIAGTNRDAPLHQTMLGDHSAEMAVNQQAVADAIARGMDPARAEEVYGPRRDSSRR